MAAKRYPSPAQVAAAVERQGQRFADQVAADVERAAAGILRSRLEQVLRFARLKWPIGPNRKGRKGHSRDLFTLEVESVGTKLVGTIRNEARDEKGRFYVVFILSAKNGLDATKTAWNQLVVGPVQLARSRVANDLVEAAQQAAREAVDG